MTPVSVIVEALRTEAKTGEGGTSSRDCCLEMADYIERTFPDLIDCPTCGGGMNVYEGTETMGRWIACPDCKDGKVPREYDQYREGWLSRGQDLNALYDAISGAINKLGIESRHDPLADLEQLVHYAEGWREAGVSAYFDWKRLQGAVTLSAQGQAIIDLSNSMHDLSTWLPGWDVETGTIQAEREEL
jgi:hypothetical protein